ncbi:MAG: exodeoxyribonuclease VII large subunit [Clostridia bacterium]|nr:exodeoxyribonuclease VII large subunit [Clostridia bacterium]
MSKPIVTVSQLNRYIASKFEEDSRFGGLFVRGEISNFTGHYASGHLYMSLKDEGSVIKAVMFKGNASRLKFKLYDGLKVTAYGRVGVYEKGGNYQLYIEDIMPDGEGALWLAFEELKKKLSAEGLFDESLKKPIPKYPETVGIITSPTGAAVQDILNILKRRYPLARVIVYPVTVQGITASGEIAAAIKRANAEKRADVLIVGRGGGSIEDLWAFNEEQTVRAVFSSEIPVISAVGHETDFTLCDFAADLRAPTPSAAAELATPDTAMLSASMQTVSLRMKNALLKLTESRREKLNRLRTDLQKSTLKLCAERSQELDYITEKLTNSVKKLLGEKKHAAQLIAFRLAALDPKAVLKRGYAVVTVDGRNVTSSKMLKKGDRAAIMLASGCATAEIIETEGNNDEF